MSKDYVCTYCATELWSSETHNDHITPRSWSDYETGRENLAISCKPCNRAKGTNDPAVWFCLLVRRDGAVLGRNETLADVRLARLWMYWGDEIRELTATVTNMLPVEVAQ